MCNEHEDYGDGGSLCYEQASYGDGGCATSLRTTVKVIYGDSGLSATNGCITVTVVFSVTSEPTMVKVEVQ